MKCQKYGQKFFREKSLTKVTVQVTARLPAEPIPAHITAGGEIIHVVSLA